MPRRRVVVIASAAVLFLLGVAAFLTVAAITQTDWGRERVRRILMAELPSVVHGHVYIGRLGGNLFSELTLDSVDVRDRQGEIFVATGRVSARYDLRDLLDQRIAIQRVDVAHPIVQFIRYPAGCWNFEQLFGACDHRASRPVLRVPRTRGFGDYVVISNAAIQEASVTVIEPWHPSDALQARGVPQRLRDSAARVALATDSNVVRWRGLVMREHRWRHATLQVPYARIADPDSVGVGFTLGDLAADESDPYFHIRHAQGHLTIIAARDSLAIRLTHWALPGSRGHGGGSVFWGRRSPKDTSDGPLRMALHIVADTASLRDIDWVYPTLPADGGGSATVDIHNERDPHILDVALSNLELTTTASHVRGGITFGVGGPYIIIKDLNLRLDPFDFLFVRQLTGQPLPFDFKGNFTGTVRARGGPVDKFLVDTANLVYHDFHVPDAVSRLMVLGGGLDLHQPDSTRFLGLRVGLGRFDLRTIEFVNPALPRLGGILTGIMTLDSLYTDVRFRDAAITHIDGAAQPTRVSGSGRITFQKDTTPIYDLAVRFDPLSFEALRPSYPGVWFGGTVAGPLRMRGMLDDVDLDTDLNGDDGGIGVHGHFNLAGPIFAGDGDVSLTHANLRALLHRQNLPVTDLTGVASGRVQGDSDLATLSGPLTVTAAVSSVDSVRLDTLRAVLRFGAGDANVDSLHVQTALGAIDAIGILALVAGRNDSLGFDAALDSLGGLRQYVGAADSLVGTARVTGWVSGWLDSLALSGRADADNLRWGHNRIHTAQSAFTLYGLPRATRGIVSVSLDTLSLGGIALEELGGEARFLGDNRALVTANAISGNGPTVRASGQVWRTVGGDTTSIEFDSLSLRTETNDWHLDRPGVARLDPSGMTMDSLTLRGAVSGLLAARAALPITGPVTVHVVGDSVPLSDLSAIAQARQTFQGTARFDLGISGTRASPVMRLDGELLAGSFGDVRLDKVLAHAAYTDRRLDLHTDFVVHGDTAVHAEASVPIDLALVSRPTRLLEEDSLAGDLRSDSAKLSTVLAVFPTLRDPAGWFSAHVDMRGSWHHPTFTGGAHIGGGAMTVGSIGVRWTDIDADVAFSRDSMAVNHATAATAINANKHGTAVLNGWLTFADIDNPRFHFTLDARTFHAVDRLRLADVTLSTVGPTGEDVPLDLSGSEDASALSGKLKIDAASIFLPELTQKQVVSLTDPELYNVIDTTLYANQRLLPSAPPRLLQGLDLRAVSIDLGDNTWLKSSEANINLSGRVDVKTAKVPSDTNRLLALSGTVLATRGTYVLNLGIVQRTFTVAQPGTIIFNGEPQFNPDLDITAVNTVRQSGGLLQQYGRPEVRIQVRLSGTLDDPKITLYSDDSLPQSDLISYLVSGVPAYELSQSRADQLLSSVVLPSLGSAVGTRLTGGVFTTFQVQTGGAIDPALAQAQANSSYQNALLATRIGAGKQIGPRTFVSADYGFCGTSSRSNSSTDLNPADQLGIKIEQQLTDKLSLDASSTPGTQYTFCTGDTPAAGFITTPRQYGLDLFRTWRF
ncbi:MAG TPA: translocation/assembly module TamB domain-containing protein [Gemmatimonadaceae bacterium]|nr:translocation/assembly module TamB domain-containing protein [Gemmatimonadaceae bacterium]